MAKTACRVARTTMQTFSTNTLRRYLPRWVLREYALFVLAVGGVLGGVWALEHQAEQVAQRRADIQAVQAKRNVNSGVAVQGHETQHQAREQQAAGLAYLAHFPSQAVLKSIVLDMNRLADEGALTATQNSYRYVTKPPLLELGQVEITGPVQGSYPQVKRYVQTLLNRYPTLGLQEITMQRSKVSDPNVTVDLRWVFYYALGKQGEQ